MKTLIGLLATLISFSALAADFGTATNAPCKVFLRKTDAKFKVTWHGACKDGFAEGLGVVRYLKGTQVEAVFYGIMKAGYWQTGVLHSTNRGYLAGRFSGNERVAVKNAEGVEDRNVAIEAFETAARAATQLSEEFEKAKNKASAKFYRDQAAQLAGALD